MSELSKYGVPKTKMFNHKKYLCTNVYSTRSEAVKQAPWYKKNGFYTRIVKVTIWAKKNRKVYAIYIKGKPNLKHVVIPSGKSAASAYFER